MPEEETFTPPCPLHTPVLFLVYKRPDTTKQVFEAIRQAKPPKLYIAADGPKPDVPEEAEKVQQVRDIVLNGVDWGCEVKPLFRDKNLGCKYGVSGGIDWFFENEEEGIILEDDTLPSQSFFWFCQELLERYRDDERVGQICGFNPFITLDGYYASYLFSKFGPIWGWASWRRVWKEYDVHMKSWPKVKEQSLVELFTDSKIEKNWRIALFDKVFLNQIDTWDYQWAFAKLKNSYMNIMPTRNLVGNIGFGLDATHTTGGHNNKRYNISELKMIYHPEFILRDKNFDINYYHKFASSKSMTRKILMRFLNA